MTRLALLLLLPTLALAAPKPLFQSKVITKDTPNHRVDIDVSLEGAKEPLGGAASHLGRW
jgi:hypothetical protein